MCHGWSDHQFEWSAHHFEAQQSRRRRAQPDSERRDERRRRMGDFEPDRVCEHERVPVAAR